MGYSNIGVDIGRSAVKIAQFSGKKLVNAAAAEIPFPLRRGDRRALVSFAGKALAEHLAGGGFRGRTAAVSLSAPSEVQLFNFSMPQMSKSDLRGAIGIEIRKSAGAELAGGVYDFYTAETSEDGSQKVMAAAAGAGAVMEKIRMFEDAGLSVSGFLTTGLALEELLNNSNFLSPGKNYLFINIGASVTSFNFFRGANLVLSREIFSGSDDITSAMRRSVRTEAGSVEISHANAENIKRTFGTLDDAPAMIAGRVPASQLSALIRPVLERLVKETVRLTSQFGRETGGAVDSIYLLGGGAGLKGIEGVISRGTGVETKQFRLEDAVTMSLPPAKKTLVTSGGIDFSVACGLALSKKPRVNLVPASVKIIQKVSAVRKGALAGGLIIALSAAGFYVSLLNRADEYRKLAWEGSARLSDLSGKLEIKDELLSLRERVAARENMLEELARKPSYYGVLKELSRVTPGGIRLTALEVTPEGVGSAEGRVVSHDLELSRFLTELEASPFFTGVSLASRTRTAEGSVRFEINFKLLY